jgi:hypothetical protein
MKEDTIKQFFSDIGFMAPEGYDFFQGDESCDTNDDYYYQDEPEEEAPDAQKVLGNRYDRINDEQLNDDDLRTIGLIKIGMNPVTNNLSKGEASQSSNKNMEYSTKNVKDTQSFSDTVAPERQVEKPGPFPKKGSPRVGLPLEGVVLESNTLINGKIYEKGSIVKTKKRKIWSE